MRNHAHRPVVVAVTGGTHDRVAVRLAATEAVLRGRVLYLLASHPQPPSALSRSEHWPPLGDARRALVDALAYLRVTHPRLTLDERVRPGDPAELLIACSFDAELVVVPVDPALPMLGELVAAHAACPVMVAREAADPGGAVVVALDGAQGADPLLEYAFHTAELRGATVQPTYVWAALPGAALGTLDPFAYDAPAAHGEADRLIAEALAGWADKHPDVVVHRREIRAPGVADALVYASESGGLLVVGARSRPAHSGLALGAVTRHLIRHAHCPVVVVRTAGAHYG